METKRHQHFLETINNERRWGQVPQSMENSCSLDGNQTEDSALMDSLNVTTTGFKEKGGKKSEEALAFQHSNQKFVFPALNNNTNIKLETDSKELSKTVAESMGLYMDSVRDIDYSFSQQNQQGHSSPLKGYPNSGQLVYKSEENLSASATSSKINTLGSLISSPYSAISNLSNSNSMECSASSPASTSNMAASVYSPQNTKASISSPVSNNLVSSTTSPLVDPSTTVSSPIDYSSGVSNLGNVHARNSAACSPTNTSNMGSPLSSPLNTMRSPISSPQSMCSVKSPASSSANMRSSVPSPIGKNINNNNMRSSISSPSAVANMSVVSPPYSSTGFPISSPVGGLGLVQNDINSPGDRDQDMKRFEFPKVEKTDGEIYSCGLDVMGKFIKNEPGTGFGNMCLLSDNRPNLPSPHFVTHIKNESDKGSSCLNAHYNGQQQPLIPFPVSETTYLSLRDNVDEYSLSGILGPPVASLNDNYEHEAFSNNVLPKRIKQEPADGCYYQENNNMPTSAIVGVNSSGHSYHYQIGAQGAMSFSQPDARDQSNPPLNRISMGTAVMEAWKSHPGLSQGSLPSRGDGYLLQRCFPENMSSSMRNSSSSSSAPAKVCLVCGDEASGCHYGVVTCGSCKVFFKRAVEGQHNYLCAGRNDCIIDKIRRKNCPACRVRKCLQAGMNLGARKSKKLGKIKVVNEELPLRSPKEGQTLLTSEKELSTSTTLVPHVPGVMPYLPPSINSVLEIIEPEVVYAGYDNTQPDTTDHLLSSLNQLAGKQMINVVKWAKVLPGFRSLPIEDQITLIQYSWMCLSSFGLSWRSYKHTNSQMLYFAPDLVFNEERMQKSAMYDLCQGMRQVSQEFVRLQLTHEEFLAMKVLLLLSTVPKDGLKNHAAFEEMRVNYIKELRRSVGKATNNSGQTWQRFYQLTKLLDAMHELVGSLLDFCFYTFRESHALKVEFPDMLVEIISDQIPKVEAGMTRTLYFHKK
ncbi:mineralocorticoid receptor [Polyodon spathula]|uniref:mineralocorticoid receptor n=1 Tax=Polyodon spathula TaxID=7913 RepID=UPI001B7DDEF2|nr:mineralocorticoid receptor [Polyodon spathula]